MGTSSRGDENYTLVNKGIFTSCQKNDTCPPWSIKAKKIKHDRVEKELIYDHPIIRVYDIPVFYLPKFYHPDPSVKRKSGFLQPAINNSEVLGSSFTMPYFKVLSENKDFTLSPIWFDTDTFMSSIEYRQENKYSSLLVDFAAVNNYESYTTKKRNTVSHLFLNFNSDLNLKNFESSYLDLNLKKISKSSYLSVFDQYITKKDIKPGSNKLINEIRLDLDHTDYSLQTGLQAFDSTDVQKTSDRYQYVLPYFSLNKEIIQDYFSGNINFSTSFNNVLSNTNVLETALNNNITFNSLDYISNLGLKNNFGINLKNLNSIGKNSIKYKPSAQSEIISLYNFDISLPLIKKNENTKKLLTPKLSFRINPSDMKNHSSSGVTVNANNAFAINRLSLSDSFETGRSLTLGLDYDIEYVKQRYKNKDRLIKNEDTIRKKDDPVSLYLQENVEQINNYFNIKLATVLRDKEEILIPHKSTLNRKSSNLFGSISNKFSDNIELGYNFSLDNDFNTLEHNKIYTILSNNNIVARFDFTEENGERGDTNLFATSIDYNINDENFLTFKTRRNRKINFTEYYDLVYQYKNDCLTAGIEYKKTYYSNGDIRPKEDLLFTITLFPITTYEHDAQGLIKDQDSFLNNLELSEEMFK